MDYDKIVEMKASIDGIIDLADHNAKAVKTYFDALVAEGFNDDQALRIVMKHGPMPPYWSNE